MQQDLEDKVAVVVVGIIRVIPDPVVRHTPVVVVVVKGFRGMIQVLVVRGLLSLNMMEESKHNPNP
jgi:hypothetical protein